MSWLTLDMDVPELPKRGDLLESCVGDRRERTWMVLRVHALRPTKSAGRCRVWAERWWQIEPELRIRLAASAERAGGQRVIVLHRYRPKKRRKTLERYMKQSRERVA